MLAVNTLIPSTSDNLENANPTSLTILQCGQHQLATIYETFTITHHIMSHGSRPMAINAISVMFKLICLQYPHILCGLLCINSEL